MCEKLDLYVVNGSADSDEAIRLMTEELPQIQTDLVYCPPSIADMYVMPFIRVGRRPYYGLEGIRAFVSAENRRQYAA